MKIELFYFKGCPSRKPALELLQKILKEENINLPVNEIEVVSEGMARELKFSGSPTIRLGGKDIEEWDDGSESIYGIKCRIYFNGKKLTGTPPEDMVREAALNFKRKLGVSSEGFPN